MKKTTFTVTFEDGETKTVSLTPFEKRDYIATVSPENFNGEYGIDWCKMNINFSDIETFQETKVIDISHKLDEATSQFVANPNSNEKQELVKKLYQAEKYYDKEYPVTWINLAKGKTATLNIIANLINGSRQKKVDAFIIEKNANFKIAYDGKTDEGENEPIKITEIKDGKSEEIEITALTTFTEKQEIVIKDYLNREVGKIEMAPNDTVDLAVKIISVVIASTPVNEIKNAKTLYQQAVQAKAPNRGNTLTEALTSYSLNQGGVHCTIEAINPTNPERIIIDVTRDNWNKFYDGSKLHDWIYGSDVDKPIPSVGEDGHKRYHARDMSTKRFVLDKLEEEYYKQYGKSFKGALLFVSDKDFLDVKANTKTLGYSQTDPIRSQGTIIFKGGLSDAAVYAHELGHMLGLEHNFVKDIPELTSINDDLDDLTRHKSVADKKKDIEEVIKFQEDYKDELSKEIKEIKNKDELSNGDNHKIKENEEIIEDVKKSIIREKDKLQKMDIKTTLVNFKVTEGKSKNYMDYTLDRLYFSKYQTDIVKKECLNLYN